MWFSNHGNTRYSLPSSSTRNHSRSENKQTLQRHSYQQNGVIGTDSKRRYQQNGAMGTDSKRLYQQNDVIGTDSKRLYQQNSVIGTDSKRLYQQNDVIGTDSKRLYQQNGVIGTDEYYLSRMRSILYDFSYKEVRASPTKVLDFLYIGGYRDAQNVQYLRRLGITHVLNCAAIRFTAISPYRVDSGIIGYEQFVADDSETYNMLQHAPRAIAFIEQARKTGGKVLVHCAMGINRSGAMVTAYLMDACKMSLLKAVQMIKIKRGTVLCNPGFQKQLVWFARNKGLL